MRFALITLGCKVNQYESQRIRQGLLSAGHCEHSFNEPGADCSIINTCTVTHRSDADGRRLIRRALRNSQRVVVTGCQALVYPHEIRALSGKIEVVCPDDLSEALQVDLPPLISGFGSHSRAFVKVQQGCDRYCAYCIVPFAKGRPVSRPSQEVISEVKALHEKGYQEVVLTGINIGLYEGGLSRLVEKVLAHTKAPRIRISSIEPWTLEDSLIDMMAFEPRLCKHLHLPLQHGSDVMLRAMGRPYTSEHFRSLITRIRQASSAIAIGADVIVGFPGEDEGEFTKGLVFLEDIEFTYLHVFPFSLRPGTAAALMPHRVNEAVVKKRAALVRELSRQKRLSFTRSRLGCTEEVLVTHGCPGTLRGITSNYLTVHSQTTALPGGIVRVRLTAMDGPILWGEPIG